MVNILLLRSYLTELFSLKREGGSNSDYIKNSDAQDIFLDIKPTQLGLL